ncbi:MAG: LysE family transporter [Planctomycetota bacterium]
MGVAIALFLVQAVVVSLSGVLAPGPVTAATVDAGSRRRHAGAWVAVGHGVVELPLMGLIVLGAGAWFRSPPVRVGIGLVGGAALLAMGARMLLWARRVAATDAAPARRGPVATGIILSAGNPYFLIWWATVGLALATQAVELGAAAFALFAVVHWLCDLAWLEALSLASFHGTRLLGPRSAAWVTAACGAVMVGFGGKFVYDGVAGWLAV